MVWCGSAGKFKSVAWLERRSQMLRGVYIYILLFPRFFWGGSRLEIKQKWPEWFGKQKEVQQTNDFSQLPEIVWVSWKKNSLWQGYFEDSGLTGDDQSFVKCLRWIHPYETPAIHQFFFTPSCSSDSTHPKNKHGTWRSLFKKKHVFFRFIIDSTVSKM